MVCVCVCDTCESLMNHKDPSLNFTWHLNTEDSFTKSKKQHSLQILTFFFFFFKHVFFTCFCCDIGRIFLFRSWKRIFFFSIFLSSHRIGVKLLTLFGGNWWWGTGVFQVNDLSMFVFICAQCKFCGISNLIFFLLSFNWWRKKSAKKARTLRDKWAVLLKLHKLHNLWSEWNLNKLNNYLHQGFNKM